MQTYHAIQSLRDALEWTRRGKNVGLVATKGNLHKGHQALIDACLAHCDITIVSIYSGPTLFFEQKNFEHYPRCLERDQTTLEADGVDMVFCPEENDLYPHGYDNLTKLALPFINNPHFTRREQTYHCDAATVWLKLLNIVQPDVIYHGEKHIQQLMLFTQMVRDLHLPTRIESLPIVRHDDGVAYGTRNQFLNREERAQAPILQQTLHDVAHALADGARAYEKLEQTARVALRGGGFQTEYVAICDAASLSSPTPDTRTFRIIGMATLGQARLTDNLLVNV